MWELTEAELRVLYVMRTADSLAAAATELGLSRHTVHNHLGNIRAKLGVKTTRQAIAKLNGPMTHSGLTHHG